MIFKFEKECLGFFSQFFFAMNIFIYCKINNINFVIDSSNWLFSYKLGWEDYFLNIDIYDKNIMDYIKFPGEIIEEYPIYEYKKYLWDIYKYNNNTKNKINEKKQFLNILDNEYGSIFIRRGDKLVKESKLIDSILYIQLLLQKYPDCKKIFLQTDDYTCYEELNEFIQINNLNIELFTLCDKKSRGVIVNNYNDINNLKIDKNKKYIEKNINYLKNTIKVIDMNPNDIYNHTLEMIIGIDIVLNSKFCILDFQSNVSRFIKLAHNNYENVFDVTGIEIDLNKKMCPCHSESVYDDINMFINS